MRFAKRTVDPVAQQAAFWGLNCGLLLHFNRGESRLGEIKGFPQGHSGRELEVSPVAELSTCGGSQWCDSLD